MCIKCLKIGKATGLDNIMTEELKHFGPKALDWLLQLFNTCPATMRIPNIWLRLRVDALLKPGKDPSLAKRYRPKSLLSHTFKLMERLSLNRLFPFVEEHLIEYFCWREPHEYFLPQGERYLSYSTEKGDRIIIIFHGLDKVLFLLLFHTPHVFFWSDLSYTFSMKDFHKSWHLRIEFLRLSILVANFQRKICFTAGSKKHIFFLLLLIVNLFTFIHINFPCLRDKLKNINLEHMMHCQKAISE